jgi:riboflavin biosynthesis pyrimidine reductase
MFVIGNTGKNGVIESTISRENLMRAQTPQGFHFKVFLDLHRSATALTATDDACLLEEAGLQVALVEGGVLEQIMQHLASLKVNSLIVEGGAVLLQSFIDAGLWDTARVERNPLLAIGNGVAAPVLPKGVRCSTEKLFGNEILSFYA